MRIRARSVHTYVRSVPSPFFSPSVKNSAEAASLALFQARGWSLATYCKHGAFASTPRSRHRGSRRRDARAPRRVAARTRLILGVARRRPSEGFATRRARAPDAAPARRRRASSRVAILRSDVAAAALETSPSRNPRRRARLRRRPAPRRRDPKRGLCSFLSPRFFLPSLTSPLPSSLPRSGARSGHRPAPPPRGSGGAQAQAQAPRAVAELVLHGREVPGASASEADVFFSRARNPKIYRDAARAHPPASDDARADVRSPLLSASFPGLLQHHDGVLSLPDGGALRQLLRGAVPAHRRARAAHGGVQLPAQGRLIDRSVDRSAASSRHRARRGGSDA